MKIYLGDVNLEEITGLEDYDELNDEYIKEVKEGKLGFIDVLDDEDKFENEEYYYYYFELIKNEDENFKLRPAQKRILVAASDYICDAAQCLALANNFDDYNHGIIECLDNDTVIFKCGNNINGKELIYRYDN